MSNKAVFLDRDRTLMQDPGYLSEAEAVKLLPGVELAVKSLTQAGYKLVVVTNQSGIARGLFTEEALEGIHAELRRQLGERGAHLDAIYFCPYHPEGTVEQYAIDSDLRKPKPGMLLKAAEEMDIDLSASWMVGDSPRDIEAGQRAGCRTIRVRTPGESAKGSDNDEDVQADFTVRNLVDGARVILREAMGPSESAPAAAVEAAALPAAETAFAPGGKPPAAPLRKPRHVKDIGSMASTEVLREVLQRLRDAAERAAPGKVSPMRLIATVAQILAVAALVVVVVKVLTGAPSAEAQLWATVAVTLQVMALSFYTIRRGG